MTHCKKRIAALAVAASLCAGALAQSWPSRPITLVLPFPAGGATDVLARSVAEEMGRQLGQPVLVDNRPGAAGIVGAQHVAKAIPDGYTLLFSTTLPLMTNQFLYAKLPYDPRKGFALISQVAQGQLVLAAHPSVPARSVPEFLTWAAQNKGKVHYGSWGIGSYAHLAGAYMSKSKDLEMNHIAYKGEAPMLQDLIGGQISVAIGSLAAMRPYLESGKLQPLAVTGERRADGLAAVPTFAQAGLADEEYRPIGWVVLAAPAGTPAPVLDRLEQEAMAAVRTTAVKARLQAAGLEPIGSSSAQFKAAYEAAMPVLERVVKLVGARID